VLIRPVADVLPHRPPFLFVDEVVDIEPGRRVAGRWTPGADVPTVDVGLGLQLPPALVVESIAQLGAYGALLWAPDGGVPLFARLDRARFRRTVGPGSVVDLVVEVDRLTRRSGHGHGTASVDGELAVDVTLAFVFAPL
jgi:3-hydroxyacyl-[acyl-carrier-protein] dehydratase